MTTMIAEIYDAFKAAGVDDEKSRKAAEAIAAYETRFHDLTGRLSLLTWMVGTNVVLTLGILGKLLGTK